VTVNAVTSLHYVVIITTLSLYSHQIK